MNNYSDKIKQQKQYYKSGKTRSIEFRKEMLLKLKMALIKNTSAITKAMYQDLGKPEYEVITTEIGIVISDINTMIKHLSKWDKPKRVLTNSYNILGKSLLINEPYGQVLIISPWNYPLQLAFSPLVGAIGGGNCVLLKTSEISVNTSKIMTKIIRDIFDPGFIDTIEGGIPETTELLKNRFDLIFFTGSPMVGSIVMEQAAKFLTPVVLELGGKSPIVIHKDADIELASKRLLFGKSINAGQTCIAPDYLLIHEEVKDAFYMRFEELVLEHYGDDYSKSTDFGKIVNDKNFDRVINYLEDGKVLVGGKYSKADRHIELTLLEVEDIDVAVMQDEIFGPILPVISYTSYDEIIEVIDRNPDPLAMYIFSSNKDFSYRLVKEVPFGGGCINDTILHITNERLPFGGRGTSGMGSYHGRFSYDTFTHQKAVLDAQTHYELSFKYPPFSKMTLNLLKKYMYR